MGIDRSREPLARYKMKRDGHCTCPRLHHGRRLSWGMCLHHLIH